MASAGPHQEYSEPSTQVSGLRARELRFLWAPLGAGLLLRLWRLGSKSLWLDEALLLTRLQVSVQEHAAGLGELYHPPLYYEIMRAWIALWGSSEIALRLPSVLLGTAAVGLVWILGRDMGLSRAQATTAVWLAAVSPLLIWYSQEARSYTPLAFLHLLGGWALVRLSQVVDAGGRFNWRAPGAAGWWVLFVLASTLSLYLHYAAVLILPLQLLYVTGRGDWRLGAAWFLGWAEAVVLFWPWLRTPIASNFLSTLQPDRFYLMVLLSQRVSLPAGAAIWLMWGGIGGAIAIVIGLGWILNRYRGLLQRLAARPWVRGLVAGVVLIALLIIVYPRAYTLKRQLAALWPFFYLFVGWVIPWPTGRSGRSFAPFLMIATLAAAVINIAMIPKAEWRAAADYLAAEMAPGDTIVLLPQYNYIVFRYYNDYRGHVTVLDGEVEDALVKTAGRHGSIWLVEDERDLSGPREPVWSWLISHQKPAEVRRFWGIKITEFES